MKVLLQQIIIPVNKFFPFWINNGFSPCLCGCVCCFLPGWMCITFAPGWIGLRFRGAKGPGLSKTLATTERSLMGVVGIPSQIITRANIMHSRLDMRLLKGNDNMFCDFQIFSATTTTTAEGSLHDSANEPWWGQVVQHMTCVRPAHFSIQDLKLSMIRRSANKIVLHFMCKQNFVLQFVQYIFRGSFSAKNTYEGFRYGKEIVLQVSVKSNLNCV